MLLHVWPPAGLSLGMRGVSSEGAANSVLFQTHFASLGPLNSHLHFKSSFLISRMTEIALICRLISGKLTS